MSVSNNRQAPHDGGITVRRPVSLSDFERMAAHQKHWSKGTRIYEPLQIDSLQVPHAGQQGNPLAFHQTLSGRNKVINPHSKAWCFFIAEDGAANIIGIFFAVGMTEWARTRHLREDLDELPVDDLPWSELYVLDPAQPDHIRYAYANVLTNWENPEYVNPLLDVAYRMGEIFQCKTLFTQFLHSGENDDTWIAEDLGFSRIRTCASKTPEQTPVSVWVKERETGVIQLQRQYEWTLEATPDQVAALASFYQSLGKVQREELVYLIQGYSISARVKRHRLKKRTIDVRHALIREALTNASIIHGDTGLQALGIDEGRSQKNNIPDLLGQPLVVEALKRIAWFYGEYCPEEVGR